MHDSEQPMSSPSPTSSPFRELLSQEAIVPFWQHAETGTVVRHPTFCLRPPTTSELADAFKQYSAMVAGYELFADESSPANGWLYVCADPEYSLDKLGSTMRRNVRRGLQDLRLETLTVDDVLAHGEEAFCDTRKRVGVHDGTPAIFRKRFESQRDSSKFTFLGAWDGNSLAAFLAIDDGNRWAEISGCFSRNESLSHRPNDTLMYYAIHHYLVVEKRLAVAYGASSIQANTNEDTLHAFKLKVGFEAVPIHRSFAVRPMVRPFVNRWSLGLVRALLRFRPSHRVLRKAEGMLRSVLEDSNPSPSAKTPRP
jgi:hypothetical protein